jgi:uncharacterized protein (DUF2235 family)
MGRRIILLSDGTGNSSAKVWRTNVWRMFESLDLSGSDQIAYYDDGVGTSEFKPLAVVGGAFGYGLKRNVLDLYKFACRNFRHDTDEIYAFGFSRGAFTIRILIGLILEQGLIRAANEQELDHKARQAYREFRRANFSTKWPYYLRPEVWLRGLRDLVIPNGYSKNDNRWVEKIRFVGLWDSVAAYGLPIDEMTRGVSQWIWPWQLPNCVLNERVQRACHALSIDDERTTFHPILWDERAEVPLAPEADGSKLIEKERISQVWFPGVHSNVGGGYPDDSLAQIPLIWMMNEAERQGLRFKAHADANPQTLGHAVTAQDKDGRIYNPRSGLGGYYRFGPRDLTALGKDLLARKNPAEGKSPIPQPPKIHESVLYRIGNNAHLYAPIGLPARYEVVTVTGKVVEQPKFERLDQADSRIAKQAKIWNLIWWRRLFYFATVGVTLWLFAFPFMGASRAADEFMSPLRWVSDIIRTLGSILPSFAKPWIDGWARAPGHFLLTALVLAAMLLYSGRLARRTNNDMGLAWRAALDNKLGKVAPPTDWLYRLRTSAGYVKLHDVLRRTIAPALFAILFVYLGLTLISHALYNVQDYAGLVCKETPDQRSLHRLGRPDEIILANRKSYMLDEKEKYDVFSSVREPLPVFRTSELCQSMGVYLERGARYLITLENTKSFRDGGIEAEKGFYSSEPDNPLQAAAMFAAIPLRRELMQPWFRIVARFGGQGGEETFLVPDPSDKYLINEVIRAPRDGELFLFVNDAVIGIPGLYGKFYGNNEGSTRVVIRRRGGTSATP